MANIILSYKGYHASVEVAPEDHILVGTVFDIRDTLAFHGESLQELTETFRDCVDTYLQVCKVERKAVSCCTPKLTSVTPKPGHKLLLTYETGEHRLFDVSPYITGSWYGELRDNAYFCSVALLPGGVGIEWLHGQDIAPHELYELSIPT